MTTGIFATSATDDDDHDGDVVDVDDDAPVLRKYVLTFHDVSILSLYVCRYVRMYMFISVSMF